MNTLPPGLQVVTADWWKSSYSGANSNCVETARFDDGIGVRDSKDAAGPVLSFGPRAWDDFIGGAKASI
ncbi:DUF397 domain-containing protein [Streptomyces sp. NPDC087428]|uniref:DUF397 domain-containing protein n=1 Tax=Streptomyces sp. NPDC087428 TaxID=3365788 RepID=UPI003830211A